MINFNIKEYLLSKDFVNEKLENRSYELYTKKDLSFMFRSGNEMLIIDGGRSFVFEGFEPRLLSELIVLLKLLGIAQI